MTSTSHAASGSGGGAFKGLVATLPGRLLALVGLLLILSGPARAFLTLDGLPPAVRFAWPCVMAAAALWPRWSLLAFLAGAALLPSLSLIRHWPPVALSEMWLLALLVPAFARVALGIPSAAPARRASTLPVAGLLLFVVATCSLVVTLYPYQLAAGGLRPLTANLAAFWRDDLLVAVSQRHLYASIPAWVTIAEGVALLWLLRWTFHDTRDSAAHDSAARDGAGANAQQASSDDVVWQAAVALCAGAIVVSALGVYQWITGEWLLPFWRVMDPNITRINASFSDVNAAGAYFALMLVPVWTMAAWRAGAGSPRIWRWVWRAGALLVALALLFTASRSAWGGALVGMLTYGVLRRARRMAEIGAGFSAWRVPVAVALALVLVVVAASAYATTRNVRHVNQETYLDTVLYTLNMRLSLNERFKGRLAFWDAAMQMMTERPLAGVGIGRFYKLVPKYLEDAGYPVIQENAHNYFLQVGAELGLLGLVPLVALLATAIGLGVRAFWIGPEPGAAHMAAAVAAGVTAFVVTCVTGHSLLLREGQMTFWPVAGLAWLLHARAVRTAGVAATPEHARARGRLSTSLAAAAVLVVLASVPFRAADEMTRLDLARMPSGLLEIERAPNGSPFQWTTGQATIYVPRDATTFVLPVRSLAPMPQTLTLTRDGRQMDRVHLTDHAWHTLRYVLRSSRSNERFYRFDLTVTPTWHPPGDARELGLMLGEYSWQSDRQSPSRP